MEKPVKCAVVGDVGIGKTSLVSAYRCGTCSEVTEGEKESKWFSHEDMLVTVEDTPVLLSVYDTPGDEIYDRLRPLCYPGVDVFLVCFSVASKESLENVKEKWYPEVRRHVPSAPVVLVGLKADLRTSMKMIQQEVDFVTEEDVYDLLAPSNFASYEECSSRRDPDRVKGVFSSAIMAALATRNRENPNPAHCCIIT